MVCIVRAFLCDFKDIFDLDIYLQIQLYIIIIMKKHLLFIFTSALILSSCENLSNSSQNQSHFDSNSTTSTVVSTENLKELKVTLPTTLTYSRFDKFQIDGLQVKDTDDTDIQDYTLTYDDNTSLNDGDYLLNEAGTYNLSINADGYRPYNFQLTILESTNFKQTLVEKSAPEKTSYTYLSTEKIDLTGLSLQLKTTYRNNSKRSKRYEELIDTSKINVLLDGVDVTDQDVTFDSLGSHTVSLVYKENGWINNEIINSTITYSIYVKDGTLKPQKYVDNTITSTVSDTDTYEVNITKENSTKDESSTDKGYYAPSEVDASFNIQTYGRKSFDNWYYTPSVGEVPFLIVPVVLPGYENLATAENLSLINKAFFGNSSDLYFESLHSYYYRSSYGQFDITGVVTDYFDLKTYDSSFKSINNITSDSPAIIALDALNWASTVQGYDLTDFDSDSDGLIDGMWIVYLGPTNSQQTQFWGFSSTTGYTGNVVNPTVNNYGWVGINFLDDSYASYGSQINYQNKDCDAHVLIHETGHMLGAYDYYTYSYSGYDPTGRCLTMSYNSNDQDLYTKMLFGWVTPYIVYDTSKLSIVASQAKKDQLIVIPYEGKQYTKNQNGKVQFNMFDEYIVLEYYTDDDLNSYDYDCYQVNHIQGKGIRMLHIDNRLAYVNGYTSTSYQVSLFSDPDEVLTTTQKLIKPISNSESGYRSESSFYGLPSSYDAFDEIRVISKDKRILSQTNEANTSTLFQSGDSFNISNYYNSFPNKTLNSDKTTYTVKFNNGKSFLYTIAF